MCNRKRLAAFCTGRGSIRCLVSFRLKYGLCLEFALTEKKRVIQGTPMSKLRSQIAPAPKTVGLPLQKTFRLSLIVVLIASFHLLVAIALVLNWLNHVAPLAGGETIHQQFAYEAATPGISLYGPLSTVTLPLWYTPLQFQVAGYLSRPFGYDLRVMRATVAFFGLGTAFLVALLTRRATGDWRASLAAAGIFLAIPLQAPWYVVLEPNAGHAFFLMLSVWLLARDESLSWRTVCLSSVTLFLCCWTKHTGLPYMLAGCG